MSLSIPEIRQLADVSNPSSFSNRMRFRRFQLFESLIATLPRPLRILDVGDTNLFWENRGWAYRDDSQNATLDLQAGSYSYYTIDSVIGDAMDLRQFDVASLHILSCNSVIAHI